MPVAIWFWGVGIIIILKAQAFQSHVTSNLFPLTCMVATFSDALPLIRCLSSPAQEQQSEEVIKTSLVEALRRRRFASPGTLRPSVHTASMPDIAQKVEDMTVRLVPCPPCSFL